MRAPNTKDFAEYFRLALEAGLCRENEIPDPFLGAVYRLFYSYDCCSKEQYNKDFEDFFVPVRHFVAFLPPQASKALQ